LGKGAGCSGGELGQTGGTVMGKRRKLVRKILLGRSDANIPFSELLELLRSMGLRIDRKEVIMF
jgi:hypothetical protein